MNPTLLQHALASAFDWTWKTSLAATILIALVLVVQFAFAKVLSPRWRYGLGLLILLRLMLPVAPASSLSIFNLGKHRQQLAQVEDLPTAHPEVHQLAPPVFSAAPTLAPAVPVSAPMPVRPIAVTHTNKINFRELASWAWLSGFAAMLFMVARQQLNFMRRLGRWDVVREPRVLEMLANCRAQLGVRRNIAVLAATGLNTPALFGIIRPRLLLPAEMLERLDDRELRHVILHELIHLRRGDLMINWAMILLRAMHWFNPAVWFAFRRLRAEQELACDAAVMARLAADERRDYGRTLLKLLDDFSPGALCAGYVPFITSKQIIKRRITMISHFKPAGRLAAGISIILLVVLGSMTFTRADETNDSVDQKDVTPSSPDDQSKSTSVRTGGGSSMTVTISKDGTMKVGTNMMLTAPAAVMLSRDGKMEMTADQMQMVTPTAKSYQINNSALSTGSMPLQFNLQKDGTIHAGNDGTILNPELLKKYIEDRSSNGGNLDVLISVEDGNANANEQIAGILDALKGKPVGAVVMNYGKTAEAFRVGAQPGFATVNAVTAQAMAQVQTQIQRAQANLAADQAAIQTYGRAIASQPNPGLPPAADAENVTVSLPNQFRQANELAAENIRLTQEKLNDLRNLKETYASDAAEHSSDQRELTSKLNDMLVEAQAQRESKAALLHQLEKMSRDEQRQALPTTVPDATLDKLMQDEMEAETKLAAQASTYGASSPEQQAIRKMINKLNLQIDERVKGILNGLRAQVQAADDSIHNMQKELDAKSQRQTELSDLASQIAATENQLRDLKSQLSGLQDYQKGTVTVTPESTPPTR